MASLVIEHLAIRRDNERNEETGVQRTRSTSGPIDPRVESGRWRERSRANCYFIPWTASPWPTRRVLPPPLFTIGNFVSLCQYRIPSGRWVIGNWSETFVSRFKDFSTISVVYLTAGRAVRDPFVR